ncbi:MAG: glutamyl-tRNA(Gln) amidotransferase, A subunit [Candidatus Magasanikbacteria bacterium]|nr:glutamyl-tRNA(Gln) amidotransferase, A subunit [Candidatus Magasanikbacteria bacterium]
MNLQNLTISAVEKGLRQKDFSCAELVAAYLARINERNQDLNAFITVAEKSAAEEALAVDRKIAVGEKLQPLEGVPFAVKDTLCTHGIRTTAAAKILDNFIPPYDATVIGKIRDNGGIVIGKNNCDAFGHGASNENSDYGPVKNPHDPAKVSGGSSGGSAAAVAADLCAYAIGEDTGGSIREPAAFCGVVGLKVSYGRTSRYGCMPMASSLDTVGPLTKTVEDAAAVMEVIAGVDQYDATTLPEAVPNYRDELKKGIDGLRIGLPREYFAEGLNEEVKSCVMKAVAACEQAGATVEEVSLRHTKYAIATYYIVVPCEDSSNMARYDGLRFGARVTNGDSNDLLRVYTQSRASGLPAEVKRRIMIGAYALSHGYYDAYYLKAQKVRTLIKQDFENVFEKVDALITPTYPGLPFGIGELVDNPLAMYLADVLTVPANLAGVPALSVPCGKVGTLPVGAQIIGPRFKEDIILRIGRAMEREM